MVMKLNPERAVELMDAFKERRLLVVGDVMLDRFIYGSVRRISQEAPVPVVEVHSETNMPGGASNVAWNIQSLEGKAIVGGFTGTDAAGAELKNLLQCGGVSVNVCQEVPQVSTTVKMRVIAEHQQVVRVDWDCGLVAEPYAWDQFYKTMDRELASVDGVILEDYGKGVVVQEVVDHILEQTRGKPVMVGYDPKADHPLNMNGITLATPNRREAFRIAGVAEPDDAASPLLDESLLAAGAGLRKLWNPDLLAITLGGDGMLLMPRDADARHIPTRAREVYDVSGAGDTVIAATMLALVSGATYGEAAEIANHAAGVVVGKMGTAPCSRAELLEAIGRDTEPQK